MKKDIVIIGAGASALICASFIDQSKYNVSILEKNTKAGRKILISGNGKCNITNENIHIENFYSSNISFVGNILKKFTKDDTVKFFEKLGLPLYVGKDGQMFPLSNQSSSVVEYLENFVLNLGVKIIYEFGVQTITKEADKFIISSANGDIKADKVIIATGGKSMSKLGTTGDGYTIAQSFSHTIIEPKPALVQLLSESKYLSKLSGVKHYSNITLISNNEKLSTQKGDVLFTNYGLSGLAILDISRDVIEELSNYAYVQISIDLFRDYSNEKLKNLLQKCFKNSINDPITALGGVINKKISSVVIEELKIDTNKLASELNTKEINKIVYLLKNFRFDITGDKGFDTAEVTTGGVCVDEIDKDTLESKKVKDLYFCGEVLDVDGDRGGYNFQWAWSSGVVLAKNL